MKRSVAALVLAALLLALAAPAQAESRVGWLISMDDISVTCNGETVALAPAVRLRVSMPEDKTDVQAALELCKDEQVLAGFWAEEVQGGPGRLALSNSETCPTIGYGYYLHLMGLIALGMDVSSDEAIEHYYFLSHVLEELDAFLEDTETIEAMLGAMGSVEREDGRLRCRIDLGPMLSELGMDASLSVGFALAVERAEFGEALFDLSEKREVSHSMKKGFFADEGIPEALEEIGASLLREESIARAFALLTGAFGEP